MRSLNKYLQHVKCDLNKAADFLANRAMDNHNDETIIFDKGVQLLTEHVLNQSDFFLHAHFDGGYRPDTCQAAAGVRIEVCQTNGMHTLSFDVMTISERVEPIDSYHSELCAAKLVAYALRRLARRILDLSAFD